MRIRHITVLILFLLLLVGAVIADDMEQDGVRNSLLLIDRNVNQSVDGDKSTDRMESWRMILDNTRESLDELSKRVKNLVSRNEVVNIPADGSFRVLWGDREKNHSIVKKYRETVDKFTLNVEKGTIRDRKAMAVAFDSAVQSLREEIAKNEPLEVLDRFDVEARIKNIRNEIEKGSTVGLVKMLKAESTACGDISAEYEKMIADLKSLDEEYQKIYKIGRHELKDSKDIQVTLKNPGDKVRGSKNLSFRVDWGTLSEYVNRGQSITARMTNVSGGNGNYRFLWTMNGDVISRSPSINYSFGNEGSYYLVAKVTDTVGLSRWYSKVYRVRGGWNSGDASNAGFEVSAGDWTPDVGQRVDFRISSADSDLHSFRWIMNGHEFARGWNASYVFNNSDRHEMKVVAENSWDQKYRTYVFEPGGGSPHRITSFELKTGDSRLLKGERIDFEVKDLRGGESPYHYTFKTSTGWSYQGASNRFSQVFGNPGMVTVTVTVRDRNNKTLTKKFSYKIEGSFSPLRIGSINYSHGSPGVGQTITLSPGNVTGGLAPYNYKWYADGMEIGSGATIRHTWHSSGSSKVTVMVTDSEGSNAKAHHTFNVGGSTPAPTPSPSQRLDFSISVSNSSPRAGDTVSFNVVNIRGGRSPYSVTWTINGSQAGVGERLIHRFKVPRRYTVVASVRSATGDALVRSVNLNVR